MLPLNILKEKYDDSSLKLDKSTSNFTSHSLKIDKDNLSIAKSYFVGNFSLHSFCWNFPYRTFNFIPISKYDFTSSICIKYCSNKIKVGDELSYKSFLLEVFL